MMLFTIVVGVVCFLCFVFFNMRTVMKGKKIDIIHRISMIVKLFSLLRNESWCIHVGILVYIPV